MKEIEGVLKISSRGFGYVAPRETKTKEKNEPVEIEPAFLNTGLSGDLVRVRLLPLKSGERQQGQVVEIKKRKRWEFVGTLRRAGPPDGEAGDDYTIIPDDPRLYAQIRIAKNRLGGAKTDEKVLIRLDDWRDPSVPAQGEVMRVLGKPGDNDTEMKAIVFESGFIPYFPVEAETEARHWQTRAAADFTKESRERRDFRNIPTFTIDPADAKDFDDAISLRELNDGKLEVGVHIADVAHYVRPETAIDQEAQNRTTSVYLVDRTIPMLPEILSNDLCSLNPDEDKLTFSAVFVFNKKLTIENEWFGRTVIRSNKRFTYEEAQKVLTDKRGPLASELGRLNRLAEHLRAEKFKKGAIEFNQEEVKFVLDKNGRPLKVVRKKRTIATMLIEDLMLLANRRVAEFVSRIIGNKERHFVYRVHNKPSIEKIKGLAEFVAPLGHRLEISSESGLRHGLNELLKAVAGTPEEAVVQTVALRTMAKAAYSTKNIGHYGLAFAHYAHFTSPIRRYPDIMVHRLLDHYLRGEKPSEEILRLYDELALHCSEREEAAQEAERASTEYKQVEYFLPKIGKVFDGVISGVTKWGIYVEEKETRAEGMVRLASIGGDYYIFDEKTYSVIGRRTRRRFRLGDKVRARLIRADLKTRQLDFAFV